MSEEILVSQQNNQEEPEFKRGIEIDAGFRQIIVGFAVVFFMLILPIFINENKENIFEAFDKSNNPYSAEALAQRNQEVAGISTDRATQQSAITTQTLTIPFLDIDLNITNDTLPFLIITVVSATACVFLVLYLFLGKFEGK
jgi:hypothetical protein